MKLCCFSDAVAHSVLGVPVALCMCIFQHRPRSIVAFLSFSQSLSSLRVEMLNGSLSNVCVWLRSYQAFKIPVSWRGKKRTVEKQSEHLEDILVFVRCGLMKDSGE